MYAQETSSSFEEKESKLSKGGTSGTEKERRGESDKRNSDSDSSSSSNSSRNGSRDGSSSSGRDSTGTSSDSKDTIASTNNSSISDRPKGQGTNSSKNIKIQLERKRDGASAARNILRQSRDESCDWRNQPLEFAKGEVCGAHYKVLGLSRNSPFDKNAIKRAFRQRSLFVHPDKNPAPDADRAFKAAQSAYDCLSDEVCREQYNQKLDLRQDSIARRRLMLREKVISTSINTLKQGYYHVSVAANYLYQLGLDVWDFAGEFELDLLGSERLPLGKAVLMLVLALKGRFLLQIHGLAYVIMRINYELAKAKGLL